MASSQPLTADIDLKDNAQLTPNSEKCELRVEGMTCGSCVEVRTLKAALFFINLNLVKGNRGHAQRSKGHSFNKGRPLSRAGCNRIRPFRLDCHQAH
jgi:hypothetical protein